MLALSEKDRKRGLVLAVGILGGLVMLDETVLGVSLPAIRSELGMSATTAHWIINSYMLAFTCLAAIGGKAIDLFGLRPAMIVSCSVFTVASLLAGFADGTAMLLSMRVVQGLCAAIMFPTTLAAATLTFDEEERGRAIGLLAGMATIFLAIGPMLGGILTDFLSWRWVFWINIPVVVVGGIFTCLLWKEPARDLKRPVVDRVGLVLLLVGMTSLIFGLMEGPDFGWASPVIVSTLIVGVIGLAGFVRYEARQKLPLIDIRLFILKPFHASSLVILLTQMSKIVVAIFIPHFLQLQMGFSALWAGIGTAAAVLPFPFLAAFAGRYADRKGAKQPVLISLALVALSCGLLGATFAFKNYWVLAPMLLLWGAALPFSMVPTGRITVNSVPLEKQGEVSGMIITCRLVGGTLGVTLGSVLLAMHADFASIFYTMAAMLGACCVYCIVALENDAPARG
ncbi:DHA2 family efflux MFS transporter permease subunit [Roseibium sp. SCP14]|uniref:DHA2 family efflux MFS transporter permease subunit n=1 Tax=Roseibium sp. SCP14 TaxID=3141375 RepID=UPI00333BCF37